MLQPVNVITDKNFGTRECPSCAAEVNVNNNRCPVCGYEFPHEPRGKKTVLWIIGVILLLALFALWM